MTRAPWQVRWVTMRQCLMRLSRFVVRRLAVTNRKTTRLSLRRIRGAGKDSGPSILTSTKRMACVFVTSWLMTWFVAFPKSWVYGHNLFISMLRMKIVLSQINLWIMASIPKWNSSMVLALRLMVWIVMPNSIRSTSLNFYLMKRSLNQKMIQILISKPSRSC